MPLRNPPKGWKLVKCICPWCRRRHEDYVDPKSITAYQEERRIRIECDRCAIDRAGPAFKDFIRECYQ